MPEEPATPTAMDGSSDVPRAGSPGVVSSLFADRRDASKRKRRAWGFVVGLVLLAGAVYAVTNNAGPIRTAFDRATTQAWWLLPALLILPVLHLPLTGVIFWTATPPRRDGSARVGLLEMTALISMGNLANYLPLRPGMVARLAYHRAVNDIPIVESAKILASVVAAGLVAAALLLSASMAAVRVGAGGAVWSPVAILVLPVIVGATGSAWLRGQSGAGVSAIWRWWAVLTFRYIDLGVWAARYAIAFWAVGVTLTPAQAAVYAVVANAAMLVPIAGNGLGLREWVVGLVGPLLPAVVLGVNAAKQDGLSADLLNRAGEVLMSIVAGTLGAGWITRHLARKTSNKSGSASVKHDDSMGSNAGQGESQRP